MMNKEDKIQDLQTKISSIDSLLDLAKQFPNTQTLDIGKMIKDKIDFMQELQELKSS